MAKKQKKFKDQLTDNVVSDITSQDMADSAVAEFRSLLDHAGWQRICKELDIKLQDQTDEILDTDVSGEDLNRLRDRRDLTLWFRNLPTILIEALDNPPAIENNENLDPFAEKVDNQES